MTVKQWIEFLEKSTKNMNAEVVFKKSKNGRIMGGSKHMCRHCEPEIFFEVPIEK